MSEGTLAALGWTDELEAAFAIYEERGFRPARVVAEHRGGYYVRSDLGDRLASARGRMRDDEIWGGMPAAEAYGTYNMGAGFVFYVAEASVPRALALAESKGAELFVAGHVEAGQKRVVIEPLALEYAGDSLAIRSG